MNNIVLLEPQIPQNTGNIVRTCAATNSNLHIIKPMGFRILDKYVKRAGLDYWDKASIHFYDNIDHFFLNNKGFYYFFTTNGTFIPFFHLHFPTFTTILTHCH